MASEVTKIDGASPSASTKAMSSADGVRVAVRVRPLNEREKSLGAGPAGTAWALTPTSMTQLYEQRPVSGNSFAFDHVFLQDVNNEQVYKELAAPVVLSTVEGVNGVIFAYGQTAAGKTHTMLGNESDPGITRRAINELFAAILTTKNRGFLLRASYIEIYNEVIKDLLVGGGDNLKIHEDVVNKRVYVNSKEDIVTSVNDVMAMLAAGEQTRAVGVTNMNERSSRSHTIFTLRVESRQIHSMTDGDALDDDPDDGVAVRSSSLTLVDLAGSERVAFTKAEGQRLKEGGHINKSLLTLGTVINKLSSGESRSAAHIPYRDSKLTRILQPALGGNARTAIVCAVTPSLIHLDETLSTLRFASRAKKVTNNAQCNEYLDDRAKLRRAEKEISRLKGDMAALRDAAGISNLSSRGSGGVTITKQPEQSAGKRIKLFNDKVEENARKRIKLFHDKFQKLVALANPNSARDVNSASNLKDSAKLEEPESIDSTASERVPDYWDSQPRLCDALDLCRPQSPLSGASCAQRRSDKTDEENAQLRMRALRAERDLRLAQSEIDCERSAMEAEVDHLVSVADDAQRAQNAAQNEWEQAMSLLATAQTASLVDEIVEGAMMISERDKKINAAEQQLLRFAGVEEVLADTSEKLKCTEKTLADSLKREKRGVGPVLKDKMVLQSKLTDIDGKLRSAKQNASKLQTEKATLEREIKSQKSQYKVLNAEVEKHRKHKSMANDRITKKHAEETKKLQNEISSLKEQTLTEKGIVGAQKAKIIELQKQLVARTVDLNDTSNELQDEQEKLQKQGVELQQSVEKAQQLEQTLEKTLSELAEHRETTHNEMEKVKSEIAMKNEALAVSAADCEQQQGDIRRMIIEFQELQAKYANLQSEHKNHVQTSSKKIGELESSYEQKSVDHEEFKHKSAESILALQGHLEEIRSKHGEVQSIFSRYKESATAKLTQQEKSYEDLKCQAAASFSELDRKASAANTKLSEQLARTQYEIEERTKQLLSVEEAAAHLLLEKEELLSGITQLSKDLENLHYENQKLKKHAKQQDKVLAESEASSVEQQKVIEGTQRGQIKLENVISELQLSLEKERLELSSERSNSKEALQIASMAQDELQKLEERTDEYAANIKVLQEENKTLEEISEKQEVLKEEASQLRQALNKKTAELESQVESSERQVATLRLALATKVSEADGQNKVTAELAEQVKRADILISELQHSLKATENKMVEKDQEKAQEFANAHANLEAKEAELTEAVQYRKELTDLVQTRDIQAAKLREALVSKDNELIEKVRVQNDELTKTRTILEAKEAELEDVIQYQEEVQFLRGDIAELREGLEAKELQLRNAIQDRDESSTKLSAIALTLKNELETKLNIQAEHQANVKKLQEMLNEKNADLQKAILERKKEANLVAMLKERGEDNEAKKELHEEVSTLRAVVEVKDQQLVQAKSLDSDLKDMLCTIDKQRDIIRKKDLELVQVSDFKNKLERLRRAVSEREDEILRLTTQGVEGSPGIVRSAEFAARASELRGESIKENRNESRVLQELNVNSQQESKSRVEKIESRLKDIEAQNHKYMVRNEGLLRETQAAAHEKIRLLGRLGDMDKRIEYLQGKLTEYGRGEGAIGTLMKRVRKRNSIISKMESELAQYKQLLEQKGLKTEGELLSRVSQAEGALKAKRLEIEAMRESVQRAEADRDSCSRDAHNLRQKLQQREATWTKSLIDRRERERVGVAQQISSRSSK